MSLKVEFREVTKNMTSIEFLRQYKVGPFSIFDFVTAYVGFYLLAPLLIRLFQKFNVYVTLGNILWLVLPLSVLTHLLIGTHTALTSMVVDPSGHYIAKAIIIVMIYLGLRGIVF